MSAGTVEAPRRDAPLLAVTGRSGQVARALALRAPALGFRIVLLRRPDLDLAEPATVERALLAARPDAIVSAAAYTAVDKAESERDLAFAVNAGGAEAAARAAARLGAPIIHLSTDYVFDGSGSRPWREDDPVAPLGVYGASKLEGERRLAAAAPDHAILRTCWVHASWGANFVRTMLRLAGQRDELAVVADQHGAPTSALAIAEGVCAVARNLLARRDEPGLRGVFHMSAGGETTWAGFAEAIFAVSRGLGGPSAAVRPIATADYPTPARRPANSRLDNSSIAARHGVRLAPWREAVPATVAGLLAETKAETTSS